MRLDSYQFYLWSIGQLDLPIENEPDPNEYLFEHLNNEDEIYE